MASTLEWRINNSKFFDAFMVAASSNKKSFAVSAD